MSYQKFYAKTEMIHVIWQIFDELSGRIRHNLIALMEKQNNH